MPDRYHAARVELTTATEVMLPLVSENAVPAPNADAPDSGALRYVRALDVDAAAPADVAASTYTFVPSLHTVARLMDSADQPEGAVHVVPSVDR